MRNQELRFSGVGARDAEEATGEAAESPLSQQLRGVGGQLRPYRDLRSGFEPWRRAALQVWAAREESLTVR